MKRIFSARRNALLSPVGLSGGAIFGIAAVLVVGVRFFAPGFFSTLVAPVFLASTSLSGVTADVIASFTTVAELRRERDAVLEQNAAFSTENLALKARLADLGALVERTELEPGLVASVLAHPPVSPYDTLVLDSGSTAGVSAGMRVFAPGEILIGEVDSVTARSARVVLWSTPERTTGVWIGDHHIPATLTGVGGGAFVGEVSKDSGVVEGDIVYAAHKGAQPMGRVSAIETSAASPSAKIAVASLANYFSLVWVRLIP